MVKDPIIKSPIKTDIPIKTLLVPLINLLITPMKITNPRKIKKETKVLPEKKLSAIKDTNINIKITPRKAIVFHLCSLIFLKNFEILSYTKMSGKKCIFSEYFLYFYRN